MVSKCTWNIFSALDKKKKEFKEKKNHINNKTKSRSLKMVMLKLNHKLPYNSKVLRFFIFNSDDSQTYWNGYAYTLARFPSDCVKQIYCSIYYFIPSFHCSLQLCSNFCCRSCRWRCSRPYVHVRWVSTIAGVWVNDVRLV